MGCALRRARGRAGEVDWEAEGAGAGAEAWAPGTLRAARAAPPGSPGRTGDRRSLGGSAAPLPLGNLGPAPRELAGRELHLPKERLSSNLGFWCLKGTQARGFTVCHSHCPLQWASGDPGVDQPPTDAQVAPGTVACCKAKASQRSADRLPRTRKIKFCLCFLLKRKHSFCIVPPLSLCYR